MAVIRRYELTDEEWERLKAYFPERKAGTKVRPPKDTRANAQWNLLDSQKRCIMERPS